MGINHGQYWNIHIFPPVGPLLFLRCSSATIAKRYARIDDRSPKIDLSIGNALGVWDYHWQYCIPRGFTALFRVEDPDSSH